MSYFIRGIKDRKNEVIKLLESKGGKNTYNVTIHDRQLYFIDKNNIIRWALPADLELIEKLCEELTLPKQNKVELTTKFKVSDIVMHEEWGEGVIMNIAKLDEHDNKLYYTQFEKTSCWCEEASLSRCVWTPKFKEGDKVDVYTENHEYGYTGIIDSIDKERKVYNIKLENGAIFQTDETIVNLHQWKPKRRDFVLVRNFTNHEWMEASFSFMCEDGDYATFGGNTWRYCIPFDENKVGKVTEN